MNQMYRYLCLALLGILLAVMLTSFVVALFFPADSVNESEKVSFGLSAILDGSFYDSLEHLYTENFPGGTFLSEKFLDLQDWYTLVDANRITE